MDNELKTLLKRRCALAHNHIEAAIDRLDPNETGLNPEALNELRECQHQLYMIDIAIQKEN